MNNKSYDRITERIVSLLTQGTVPWHKPWHIKTGLPRNLVSQKPYRGINVFLLMAMNYESPHWLTLRQANLLGGQIKPGEKSCPVVFWKPMKVKDLSLIHISEPTRLGMISYAVFCLKK